MMYAMEQLVEMMILQVSLDLPYTFLFIVGCEPISDHAQLSFVLVCDECPIV
jgi:hypothetical protein